MKMIDQNGFFVLLMFIKYSSSAKREFDFRSDWALCCRFRTDKHLPLTLRFRAEQSFLGASDEPLRYAVGSRANRCFLRESVVQRSDSDSTEVGHEDVITGCDGFSLRSSIANPQGVAQSPIHIAYIFCDIINLFCLII
ncbi:hypothetical protein [Lysinibacillus xylanilyticus]|uniref:hypothetical protein n=1 Tax=Lysinibacillus xylanilyticus TaxID=582475 RepID=UPI003CFECC4A